MKQQEGGTVVIRVGSKVTIGGDIEATITGVTITNENMDHVRYEVSWFNGRSHEARWMEACEIDASSATVARIGFGAGGQS